MKTVKKISAMLLSAVIALSGMSFPLLVSAAPQEDRVPIIVSLGDSYSSGEGIDPFFGQTDITEKVFSDDEKAQADVRDWAAHRSEYAWSGQLEIDDIKMSEHRNENWFFVAASGAVINNLGSEQNKPYDLDKRYREKHGVGYSFVADEDEVTKYNEIKDKLTDEVKLSPQLKIFETVGTGNTDYVTLTLSGNDIDFVGVVKQACRAYSMFDVNELTSLLNKKIEYFDSAVSENLRTAYAEIQSKAGSQAKIIVAGYPRLLNQDGSLYFSAEASQRVSQAASIFNQKIEKVVNNCREKDGLNVYFVSVEGEDCFGGHEVGTKEPYIHSIVFPYKDQDLEQNDFPPISAYSIHPNEKGAEAYATAVQKKINEMETNGLLSGIIYEDRSGALAENLSSRVEKITAVNINTDKEKAVYVDDAKNRQYQFSNKVYDDLAWSHLEAPTRYYCEDRFNLTGYYEMVLPPGNYHLQITYTDGTTYFLKNEEDDSTSVIEIKERDVLKNKHIYLDELLGVTEESTPADDVSPAYEWCLEPSVEAEDINVADAPLMGENYGDFIASDYALIRQNGKWGIIDKNGKIIIEPAYEAASGEMGKHFVLINQEAGQWNVFCTKTANLTINGMNYCDDCDILSTTFYGSDYFYDVDKNLLALSDSVPHDGDGEFYLYGQNGIGIVHIDEAVTARSAVFPDNTGEWDGSVGSVEPGTLGNTFGVVKGDRVLQDFIYENATAYKNGTAALCKGGKWGYVDSDGKVIIPFEFDADLDYSYSASSSPEQLPYLPSEYYIALNQGDNGGYYNTKGECIIPVGTFAEVRPVCNGTAWVKDKETGLWGRIRMLMPAVGSAEDPDWETAYEIVLENFTDSAEYNWSESMFDLVDINGDSIPELFISQGTAHAYGCQIYTMVDGFAVKLGEDNEYSNGITVLNEYGYYGEVQYCSDTQTLMAATVHTGVGTKDFYQLENGNLAHVLSAWDDSSSYFDEDDPKTVYRLNDEEVSRADYDTALAKYKAGSYEEENTYYTSIGRAFALNEDGIHLGIKFTKDMLSRQPDITQYTASELMGLSTANVIWLMGGNYTVEFSGLDTCWFFTNEKLLPGVKFGFSTSYYYDYDESYIREGLEKNFWTYETVLLSDNARLDAGEGFHIGMRYSDCIEKLGYSVSCSPTRVWLDGDWGYTGFTHYIQGHSVAINFDYEESYKEYVSSDEMSSTNPTVIRIGITP